MATGPGGLDPGPDEELWQRLRVGDHFALGELFDRYADEVRAFAFRRTASRDRKAWMNGRVDWNSA